MKVALDIENSTKMMALTYYKKDISAKVTKFQLANGETIHSTESKCLKF